MLETVFRKTRDGRLAVVILTVGIVHIVSYFAATLMYGPGATGMFVVYMYWLGVAMTVTATVLYLIEKAVLRDQVD